MSEIKESLKKMGWDEKLIDHYIGKEHKVFISSVPNFDLKPTKVDANKIYADNDRQFVSNKLLI